MFLERNRREWAQHPRKKTHWTKEKGARAMMVAGTNDSRLYPNRVIS
jgi:hypothetical protein